MRIIYLMLLVGLSTAAYAQKKSEQTKSFRVTGEVKEEKKFTIDDFPKYRESSLGDVVITNHAGEVKSTQRKLKGILLRDVLAKVEIKSENPRVLSEFYIVCKASDGYTIVFSWNEIFNHPAGESVYLITSKDGVTAADLDESILMTSPRDYNTGRRFLKGLAKVEIKRIQ